MPKAEKVLGLLSVSWLRSGGKLVTAVPHLQSRQEPCQQTASAYRQEETEGQGSPQEEQLAWVSIIGPV